MRWLGDLVVYVGVVAMVGFFVYAAIRSKKNEKDKKPQDKAGKPVT